MNYITVLGDTFDSIAFKEYGNALLATPIIEANVNYANVVIFSEGVTLLLPEIDTTPLSSFPPWKR